MDNSKKKLTISAITVSLLLLGFIFIVFLFLDQSFGWFSPNFKVDSNGMSLAVQTDTYEIYIKERTTEYDREEENNEHEIVPVYPYVSEFKDYLDDTYSLTFNSSLDSSKLALELESTVPFEDKYSLLPGSFGEFSFYIASTDGESSVNASFKISLSAFNYNVHESRIEEIETPTLLNLLKGHFLFFETRTGDIDDYAYDNLITDGTFTYDTESHSEDIEIINGKEYYKVTIYWEWPLDYYDIYEKTNTKYPSSITEYVDDNRSYFFAANHNSSIVDLLSDGYNDGDQLIGEGIDFLLLHIDAS